MPMMPAAPGLFSTTTGTPQRCDRCGCSSRASESAVVPGVNGTTSTMVRDGESCAQPNTAAQSKATPAISLATGSDGDVGLALSVLHRIQRMLLEIGFHGDDERGRAHELGLRAQPRRLAALLDFLPGFYQPLTRDDDRAVGGPEILLGPVRDGSHAFLHRRILHGETLDAVVVAAALLFGTINQVIVAAVGDRTERSGYQLGMNDVTVLDELGMLLGYGAGGMKRH